MKKVFLFLLFALVFFLMPNPSHAEVIRSFDVDIKAHKNGLMDITETIVYDFEDLDRHGIFRFIPLYSKVGNLYRITEIKNVNVQRDGKEEKVSKTNTNEELSLKIGDPDKEISGKHTYKISYTVENGIGSNFDTHDEIYWNATGNDWQITIEKARTTVSTDFNSKLTQLVCYEGPTGSTDKCKVEGSTTSSSQIYYPGYGMTLVAVYPVGTFPKSILSKDPPMSLSEKLFGLFFRNYYLIFLFLNVVLPLYLFYWYQKRRNKKSFKNPAVNFDTPEDSQGQRLPPAVAGTIDSAKLEKDDITATIFDLGIRKYLKIEEKKKVKYLQRDGNELTITKLKEADNKLLPFEKTLFDRLFQTGDSVEVSTLKTDFYKTFEKMENNIFKELVEKGYYTKNPKVQRAFLLIFSFMSLFTLNIVLSGALFFLYSKLTARTTMGDEVDFKIDGLKLFLKSMDRNFKWQAEKFYTVEAMIPYAIALGYIDKFMAALKILKPDYNPTWYHGSRNFYTSYSLFNATATSSITTSAPSSSSGSSGGSSGGGGGGGGGGSW